MHIWVKVFKNGQVKFVEDSFIKTISVQIIKDYLTQILLGLFLNNLTVV